MTVLDMIDYAEQTCCVCLLLINPMDMSQEYSTGTSVLRPGQTAPLVWRDSSTGPQESMQKAQHLQEVMQLVVWVLLPAVW